MDTGPTPLNFLPLPVQVPIRHRDDNKPWSAAIAQGLIVENSPPLRLIRHGDRVVGQYPLGSEVEERFMLLRMVELRWITAVELAAHWGLHRNTLGNWAWRYRYFGLDGLVKGRLPAKRDHLEQIVRAAAGVVEQVGRRMTVAELRVRLEAQGFTHLPRTALVQLRLTLLNPDARAVLGEEEEQGDDPSSSDDPPVDTTPPTSGGQGGGGGESEGRGSSVWPISALDRTGTALVPQTPPPPAATDTAMQHAGLGLLLPAAQDLVDPLRDFCEEHWGGRPWHYRPSQMLLAFMLYVAAGFRNPEQVKAAPTPEFGPLLGRRRGPACITLRRRLPPLARVARLVAELQQRIAERYLSLGWVVPGWWLVDGHFSPYHGMQAWGKGWWPQRRLAYPGFFAQWLHDRRGRPLWLHVTQGFELFADQIPVVADGLRGLLAGAEQDESPVLVFDRGGYNAEVFRSLNARGVGWVTWLKAKVALPASAFVEQGELGPAARTIHYACFTHAVQGCHDHVAAIAWHHGDPAQQVALLHNTDGCQPGRWSPLQLIGMLASRWSQENAFKSMVQQVDIDWTNGYLHQPCADTPVPNPEVRRLRARLGTRTAQLRRAMSKPAPRRSAAAATHHRRIGILHGQITRLKGRLDTLPASVPYGTLGRAPTAQLHPGRGLLFPVLRAAAYHLRLQLRDRIAAVFPDHREHDKVLRVLLHSPGRYVHAPEGDWIIIRRPALPRYARALQALLADINADPPHAPHHPRHPLRFALEG